MTKTITKVGNSQGIIFDTALMDLAHVKVGDKVNVTVHPGGSIVLTPLRSGPSSEEVRSVIKKTAKDYRKTLRKLAGAQRPKTVFISASRPLLRFIPKRSSNSVVWAASAIRIFSHRRYSHRNQRSAASP